ncbi:MAG: hypothetical protein ACTHLU_04265 [Novosphingobium sp.]
MRQNPALAPNLRRGAPVPPLPHPSWSAAASHRQASRRLSAGEFWDRLGL